MTKENGWATNSPSMTSDAVLRESIRQIQDSVETNYASALPSHQDLSDAQEVVFLFLASCMDHLVSIGHLLGNNRGESARILFRTLFVDSSRLNYMHKHRERLDGIALAFELESIKEQCKWAALLDPKPAKTSLEEMLSAREVELRSGVARLMIKEKVLNRDMEIFRNQSALMDAVGTGSMGYSMYKHASQIAHSSVFALRRRRTLGDDGKMRLSHRSSDREVIEIGLLSLGVFLAAFGEATDLLDWDKADSVSTFADFNLIKVKELANINREKGLSEVAAET